MGLTRMSNTTHTQTPINRQGPKPQRRSCIFCQTTRPRPNLHPRNYAKGTRCTMESKSTTQTENSHLPHHPSNPPQPISRNYLQAPTASEDYPVSKLKLGSHQHVQMQISPDLEFSLIKPHNSDVDQHCFCKPHFPQLRHRTFRTTSSEPPPQILIPDPRFIRRTDRRSNSGNTKGTRLTSDSAT